MKHVYSEFDGEEGRFLSPDDLFPSQGLVDFILEYGQDALDALPQHPDEQIQQLIRELLDAGLLETDEQGNLRLTPRMLRGIEHRALLEIFRDLRAGVRDGHESPDPGARGDRSEGSRPYQWGDPLSEIDLHQTLRNAMRRAAAEQRPALPLKFNDHDVAVYDREAAADSALCVLIDLSGSMMRYGRHIAAKRVALGLRAMVRRNFPLDSVEFVGFASTAERLTDEQLPLVMPKPITTREWEVRVRVPLDQAEHTHPHFTNLQHALRLARQRLARSGAANRQIFVITDGQPTAHLTPNAADPNLPMLNLVYPPSEQSAEATLREAFRCHQEGIRISSFALIEEYYGMDWVGFVDQLTRLVRGVAFYCTAGDLGATIMESYLSGKREKKPLA